MSEPLWRQIVAVARDVPTFYLNGLDRWLMRLHGPVDGVPYCAARHRELTKFPCDDFMAAADRVAARQPLT